MNYREAAKTSGVSHEQLRKIHIAAHLRPDLADQLRAGEITAEKAYREAIGDDQISLFARISPHAHDLLRAKSEETGLTMAQIVDWLIRQIFDSEDEKGR